MREPGFAAGLKRAWSYLREVTGDDAYERYLRHQREAHPGEAPLSRDRFFRERQDRKWSKISRCC